MCSVTITGLKISKSLEGSSSASGFNATMFILSNDDFDNIPHKDIMFLPSSILRLTAFPNNELKLLGLI